MELLLLMDLLSFLINVPVQLIERVLSSQDSPVPRSEEELPLMSPTEPSEETNPKEQAVRPRSS